jgi:hypothetical protein
MHLVDHMCLYKKVKLKCNTFKLEIDRLQDDSPAACDIAQQYFCDTFVSLHFPFFLS